MNNLDLVLFSNTKGFFKPTSWDSIGIVVVDPTWLYPGLKGTYIWSADNRLTPWSDHFGCRAYIRRATLSTKLNLPQLKDASERLQKETTLQQFYEISPEDSSGLVAYILVRLQFLNFHGIRKHLLTPNDFAPGSLIDRYILPGISYSAKLDKIL